MWNHADPAGSERKFRAALETASGDTALILQTQIARTYGIRQQFDQARAILQGLDLSHAGPEASVNYWLEWGRTFCSATHAPESQTDEARDLAYMEASSDPKARTWAGSLHNNVGYALHQVGRLEEALEQFNLVLAARELQRNERGIRIAHWMIA
jgi:tetratricopeptide (TPR) repeat protein